MKYFGNLLNEINSPYTLKEFKKLAIDQSNRGIFRLYTIQGQYAVAKVLNGVIVEYTVIDTIDNYKALYTGQKNIDLLHRQAIWQGSSVLLGIGLEY